MDMFSHVMLGADDIDRSKEFYDATIGALGGVVAAGGGELCDEATIAVANDADVISMSLGFEPETVRRDDPVRSAVWTRSQHPSTVVAAGTSSPTNFPSSMASTAIGTCHSQGVATMTPSRSLRWMRSR